MRLALSILVLLLVSAAAPAQQTGSLPDPDLSAAGVATPSSGGASPPAVPASSLGGPSGRASAVQVTANGNDNYTDPDYHTIANTGTTGITDVLLDISIVGGAFWDFDGSASFMNATQPVISASSTYGGTVTFTIGGSQVTSFLTSFNPPLAAGETLVFGADTDFFLGDPCPGGNFGLAPALVVATFADNTVCTATYAFNSSTNSTADCGAGCSAPTLTVTNLVAGQTVSACIDCATPGGLTFVAFSLAGGGPSNNLIPGCGVQTFDLTQPINVLPPVIADPNGSACVATIVPPGTTGVSVWVQGFDLGSCTPTNGEALTIG